MTTRILFFGDSYTHGTELWEEQSITGYSKMDQKKSRKHIKYTQETDLLRRDLTYTGYIKKAHPYWQIHNFAKGGSSMSMIAAEGYSHYARLKALYPDDKFVVINQDTFRNRFTFFRRKTGTYEGLNCDNLTAHYLNYPETADLVKFAQKFLNDENLGTQFYCQSMGIKEFFRMNDVPFLNFTFYNHEYTYREDTSEYLLCMKEEYLKHNKIFPMGALQRAYDYYGVDHETGTLPGGHLKSEYHKIIAQDLVDYIKANML